MDGEDVIIIGDETQAQEENQEPAFSASGEEIPTPVENVETDASDKATDYTVTATTLLEMSDYMSIEAYEEMIGPTMQIGLPTGFAITSLLILVIFAASKVIRLLSINKN